MKRIIVTPAGRERYISLLNQHLQKQRSSFDEWHLWLNTESDTDIDFLNKLDANIITIENSDPKKKNLNLNGFYEIDSWDSDSLYLKLDDDIVWMEPNFIDKMFSTREQNTSNFLIFANTINNSTCSHLHMRNGQIEWSDLAGYSPSDSVFWSNPSYAEKIHNHFLSNIINYQSFYTQNWYLFMNERVSINAVSWRWSDFANFKGFIDGDDELFLTYHGPSRALNKRSLIYGEALCSHYSYKTQMEYLDNTDILSRYNKLLVSSV